MSLAVTRDGFVRSCRNQRIPDLLSSILINAEHLTTLLKCQPSHPEDPFKQKWQEVLLSACFAITVMIDTLAGYLAAVTGATKYAATQEMANAVSSDQRMSLQRALFAVLEAMHGMKVEDDPANPITSVLEATRTTIEHLHTLAFTAV